MHTEIRRSQTESKRYIRLRRSNSDRLYFTLCFMNFTALKTCLFPPLCVTGTRFYYIYIYIYIYIYFKSTFFQKTANKIIGLYMQGIRILYNVVVCQFNGPNQPTHPLTYS